MEEVQGEVKMSRSQSVCHHDLEPNIVLKVICNGFSQNWWKSSF